MSVLEDEIRRIVREELAAAPKQPAPVPRPGYISIPHTACTCGTTSAACPVHGTMLAPLITYAGVAG